MKGLFRIGDLSPEEVELLMETAEDMAAFPEKYREACRGKKLATLFFEPSTRTRLSFESAMLELGGSVLGFSSANSSSASKGESVTDTARTVGCYADVIAMRHPEEGAPMAAAVAAGVPVINAGDGGHEHPTQTLADLLTIHRRMGRLSNMTVGLCGDLKYGRTVHSLLAALMRYENIRVVLISPPELRLPGYVKREMDKAQTLSYEETECLEGALPELDILYMTRIQRERFEDPEEYERLKGSYILTPEKMRAGKPTLSVLHPLPRVDEISPEVDEDKRAAYFEQVANGKLMRQALILRLLDLLPTAPTPAALLSDGAAMTGVRCTNRRCVTEDLRIPARFQIPEDGKVRCLYCDAVAR